MKSYKPPEHPLAFHAAGTFTILMLTAVLYFLVVQPLEDREHAVTRMRQHLAEQTQRADQLERTRRRLENRLQACMAELASAKLNLRSPKEVNSELAHVAEIAAQAGLIVENLDPGGLASGRELSTQAIHLGGRGSFKNCMTFMSELRKASPETSVRTFSLASDASATNLRFDMELLWYSLSEGTQTADAKN